eukprot:PhF_6_TR11268/c0_g2_i3/m.18188
MVDSLKARNVDYLKELEVTFSPYFISQLDDVFRRSNMDGGSTVSSTDFSRILKEIYSFTGTPCPMDDQLRIQVEYFFQLHGKDDDAVLDMHEFCVLLLQSDLKRQIRPRWKSLGPRTQPEPKESADPSYEHLMFVLSVLQA